MEKQIISEKAFWDLIDDFESVESLKPKVRRSFKYYVEQMQGRIEELEFELNYLKDEYRKLEQDLRDNYQPLPRSCYTGDSDDDRY